MMEPGAVSLRQKAIVTVLSCALGILIDRLLSSILSALCIMMLPYLLGAAGAWTSAHAQRVLGKWRPTLEESDAPLAQEALTADALIGECLRRGDVQAAEAKFVEELDGGVRMAATTFNTIIVACLQSGRHERARCWLARMLAHHITFDTAGCDAVVDACAKVGDVQTAEAWLEKMTQRGVKATPASYVAIIFANCSDSKNIARAEEWLKRMVHGGCSPDALSCHWRAVTACHNAVIRTLAESGYVFKAQSWLENLRAVGVRDIGSFKPLICAHFREGNPSLVDAIVFSMMRAGVDPDVECYGAVVQAWARAGDRAQSEKWMKRAAADGVTLTSPRFALCSRD